MDGKHLSPVLLLSIVMHFQKSFDNREEKKVIWMILCETEHKKIVLIVLCHQFGVSLKTKQCSWEAHKISNNDENFKRIM